MSSHDDQVNQQFSPVAAAYLKSNVHARGADLETLARKFEGQSRSEILDLGCGAGHLSFALAPHVRTVTAVDLSAEMLMVVAQEARTRRLENIRTCRGAAEGLPFSDQSFEYVCTRYSAHHWADLPKSLSEMHRVLKAGGRLMIIDVIAPNAALLDTHLQTLELLRDVSHVRNYSWEEWSADMSANGFRVEAHHIWKLRLEFDAWVARMQTPVERVAVIRALLASAPQEVREYLMVESDASFQVDVVMLEACARA
jgi:ubiquinone/menaquinone biosynthesis C-methylase UbiE